MAATVSCGRQAAAIVQLWYAQKSVNTTSPSVIFVNLYSDCKSCQTRSTSLALVVLLELELGHGVEELGEVLGNLQRLVPVRLQGCNSIDI